MKAMRKMRGKLFFTFLLAATIVPFFVLFLSALAPGWRFPELIPTVLDTRGVEYLASQSGDILTHLGSSVLYSLCTVIATAMLCIIPAHHLARHTFRGKAFVEGMLLAPALVPSMTFSFGIHVAFLRLGLTDTLSGVVLVLTVFSYPYMLRALIAGYQSFRPEYELCAANLGAGRLTRLLRVELPLLVPSLVAGGTVVFLVAFSEYFLVFLIGGGRVGSFTGYLFPLLNSSDRSVASALTLVFLLVPLTLFLVVELLVGAWQQKMGLHSSAK